MVRSRSWSLAIVGAALAIGLAVVGCDRASGPPLPPPPATLAAALPAAFTTEVNETRRNAERERPNDDAVRHLAALYLANRAFPEARQCYARIDRGRLTARDHYHLAEIALNADGDLAGGIAELTEVLERQADYAPARLALAEAQLKLGAFDQASDEFKRALAAQPDNLPAMLGLARIEIAQGHSDAAASRLEDIMANHPEATSAAAVFADLLQQRGETDRAVAMTQWSQQKPEPIPADPWKWELWMLSFDIQQLGLKAEEYSRTGQMDEVNQLLARIESIDPRSPTPAMVRAQAAMQAHQSDQAVRWYQQSLTLGADPQRICPIVVTLLLAQGQTAAAEKFIAPYVARYPDAVALLAARADVAVQSANVGVAREALVAVLRKDPHLYKQNMDLAKILWSAGDRESAASYLRAATGVQPQEVPAHALLGQHYLARHQPGEAITWLQSALKNAKADTPAFTELRGLLATAFLAAADAEAERGALPDALRHYDAAAELSPNDAKPYFGKANAAAQARDFPAAAEALRRLAALEPNNPTIYLSLGDVLYQAAKPDDARAAWSSAAKLVKDGEAELRTAINQRLNGPISPDLFR